MLSEMAHFPAARLKKLGEHVLVWGSWGEQDTLLFQTNLCLSCCYFIDIYYLTLN